MLMRLTQLGSAPSHRGFGVYDYPYTPLTYDTGIDVPIQRERPCPERRNEFCGPVPPHLTRNQISYIPQAGPGEIALDLGCGNGLQRGVLEALGDVYYGVDFASTVADDLVDAHALAAAMSGERSESARAG